MNNILFRFSLTLVMILFLNFTNLLPASSEEVFEIGFNSLGQTSHRFRSRTVESIEQIKDRKNRDNDGSDEISVSRNQIVTLIYSKEYIEIRTEARSLGAARIGDRIRVLNISSRRSVIGRIVGNGLVRVE